MNSALLSALTHSLWQCAALAFVLAMLFVFVRAAKARYALACAALAAMPLAFGITLWLALPQAPVDAPVRSFAPVAMVMPETFDLAPTGPSFRWDVVSLWMAGVVAVGLYRLIGWLAAQRLRRRGVCAAPPEWQARVAELSRAIRSSRPVRLLESTLVDVPMTIGALRPVILVPLGMLAGMPARQVEAILLHELAHIARYDYFVNLLQAAVEAGLFYHPAAWWVSRVVRREREMCCDDAVIAATNDAVTYARALADLEQYRATQFALAATDAPLAQRIHRMLGKPARGGASIAAAVAFAILGSGAMLFAFPNPEPAPEPVPVPAPMPDPEPAPIPLPQAAPAPQAPVEVPERAPAPQAAPVPESAPTAVAPPITEEQRRTMEARLKEELETPYKKWMNEEVIWIITEEERAAFGRLRTDDERQQFIEQFWIRRDPTPGTEENEYKEEHYRRVAWSNDRFSTGIPGWKTDRGMIYVKFGAPDEREDHPAEGTTFPYQKWRYKYLEGIGQDLMLEFVDDTGDGSYRMTWNPTDKDALLRVPGAGLELYQQMNMFDRLQRFVNTRPPAAK